MTFDELLDRVDGFIGNIDKAELIKALKILLKLTKIVFKFVPMTAEQKVLFAEITEAAAQAIEALEG